MGAVTRRPVVSTVPVTPTARNAARTARCLAGDLDDASTYQRLATILGADRSALFYLAIPASEISAVAQGLAAAHLLKEKDGMLRRLVI